MNLRTVAIAAAAALVVGGIGAGITFGIMRSQAADLQSSLDSAAADLADRDAAIEALADQVEALETTPTPTSTPTSTSTQEAAPAGDDDDGILWKYMCHDSSYNDYDYETLEEVWSASEALTGCEAQMRRWGAATDTETAAVKAAYGRDGTDGLDTLYGTCADLSFSHYGGMDSYSAEQAVEIRAALTLCPDQPAAADVEAKLQASAQADADRAAGTRFYAGVKRVGEDIQAGTYVVEGNLENCYWERQNSAGEIIDNNFIGSGLRAEVWIDPSDYAFSSTGCGEWVRQ